MKANLKKIRKHRKFSDSFKLSLVKEFETGRYSVVELERLHDISDSLIYSWIYKYSKYNEKGYRMVEHTESSTKKVKELQDKIKLLEAIVGQKQIKIDFLEKMIDIAKEELDIDIKKNYSTPQSNTSNQTKTK
ncbi:MAG: transposase [Chitinophagales bacterium]|nr:transposase [Chitinophagales bacterium]MCB9034590.1 transposase [Chitinophagales bacterium]